MKITEIISTPALEESLTGDAVRGLIGLGKKALTKGAGAADDAARAAADAPTSWQGKLANYAKTKDVAKQTARANAEAFAYASKHLAPEATTLLKSMLLFETAVEYYIKLRQLHAKYPGSDEDDEQNPEFIKERLHLRGLMISQWLAPKIANLGLNAAKVASLKLIPFVEKAANKFYRVPYAGPALIDWTKPAVRLAFTTFIVSPAGGRWLAEVLGGYIDDIGSIPTLISNIYNWLADKLSKEAPAADAGTADSGAQGDAAGTSTAPNGQAGQSATGKQKDDDGYDPNRLTKVNSYDFNLKDINDKKDYSK